MNSFSLRLLDGKESERGTKLKASFNSLSLLIHCKYDSMNLDHDDDEDKDYNVILTVYQRQMLCNHRQNITWIMDEYLFIAFLPMSDKIDYKLIHHSENRHLQRKNIKSLSRKMTQQPEWQKSSLKTKSQSSLSWWLF